MCNNSKQWLEIVLKDQDKGLRENNHLLDQYIYIIDKILKRYREEENKKLEQEEFNQENNNDNIKKENNNDNNKEGKSSKDILIIRKLIRISLIKKKRKRNQMKKNYHIKNLLLSLKTKKKVGQRVE